MKNCTSSIRCRDSNSRPLEHESPRITTRPWLPPMVLPFTYETKLHHHHHVLLYLPIYLPTYLPTYLPAYLPTYLSWPMSSVDKPNIQTSGQKYFFVICDELAAGQTQQGGFPVTKDRSVLLFCKLKILCPSFFEYF